MSLILKIIEKSDLSPVQKVTYKPTSLLGSIKSATKDYDQGKGWNWEAFRKEKDIPESKDTKTKEKPKNKTPTHIFSTEISASSKSGA